MMITPTVTVEHDADDLRDVTGRNRGSHRFRPPGLGVAGVLYVWVLIIIVFSLWAPDTFPTAQTAKTILNQNAITALAALALVLPMSTGSFDASIGETIGLSGILVTFLLVKGGMPVVPAVLLTLAVAVLIGLVNSALVVGMGIMSLIATIATGALIAAATTAISDQQPIVGLELFGAFAKLGQSSFAGITLPVLIMLLIAAAMWWLFEHTVTGRRLYAVGFNQEASKLAGIRPARLRVGALVVCSVVACIAGISLASQLSAGSPEAGPSYLLDAFAAAFLGSTQFRPGRFNPQGTVVAVMMLGTGKTGLQLVGAPLWAGSVFSGVVLIVALAISQGDRIRDLRNAFVGRRSLARQAKSA